MVVSSIFALLSSEPLRLVDGEPVGRLRFIPVHGAAREAAAGVPPLNAPAAVAQSYSNHGSAR
jgi:hypothetical protein